MTEVIPSNSPPFFLGTLKGQVPPSTPADRGSQLLPPYGGGSDEAGDVPLVPIYLFSNPFFSFLFEQANVKSKDFPPKKGNSLTLRWRLGRASPWLSRETIP